jgi:flagellin
MGLRIRTNIASVNAQRRMENSTLALQDTNAKLASGYRINKAADDAAGLSISENLRANTRSLDQAKRNANDGISLVQTAEGGLMETSNMLIRLRELAVQSSSDTIGPQERQFVNQEFLALKDEIDRIANTTEFNGTRLLTGNAELPEEMRTSANEYPLEIQVSKDYYAESDSLDSANPVNVIRIDLQQLNAFTDGEGSLAIGKGAEGAVVETKQQAKESIGMMDNALTRVSEYRSYLGAIQNRLTSTVRNLGIQVENISEARSRIMDADFATETAELAKNQIMQQAGIATLANANQQPQVALRLLG